METILVVEEDPLEARTLMSHLADGFRALLCPDACGAREAARRCSPSAIVVGLSRGDEERRDLIRSVASDAGGAPVIALSGEAEPRDVVMAMRAGAWDYLRRPCGPDEVRRAIRRATSPARRQAEPRTGTEADGPYFGRSPASIAAEERLRLYASSSYPVLIIGESGTGKEVAARALHRLSPRRDGPFVARNCAAIPELLAESELFGTERGAFTDAVARPGAFELARGGLLFLDEIGDAAGPLQAKLLRVLETGEFWRLGGRNSVAADFRFVSATGRDLKLAAAEGRFRLDLLFRIDTLVLEMPPLRERREDIPDLASRFADLATRGRACLSAPALDKLSCHDWPGNVRQLRNVVHRALVLASGADEIGPEYIEF
jgi:DNA-binding NtrC family response regulator